MSQANQTLTIALFGRTGAGKSTLGNHILGKEHFKVGHSLNSETESVAFEVFTWPLDSSLTVKIVDTPGFADTRPEMTNELLLSKILDFLKNMKDGLHIAIYCLPAKARVDQHDTQELEMLGLLLGEAFFDHACIAITHVDTFTAEHQQTIDKNFRTDLPRILLEHHLPPITDDRILFADFPNLRESFLKPLTTLIQITTSYVPELSEEINTEDPKSIKKFLEKPEMKEVMNHYENMMAAQKQQMENMQQTIAQKSQETQQLIQGHRQELKNLENNLEKAREESRRAKNQTQKQKKNFEDYTRQEEMRMRNLKKQIASVKRQNESMQKMAEKKDDDIKALNAKIDELNKRRFQPPFDDDDDGPCDIF